MRRTLALLVLATALAGCNHSAAPVSDDGPSADDLRAALEHSGARMHDVERIACRTAPDRPGYVCDYRGRNCPHYGTGCREPAIRTGRFVSVAGGWMFMGDLPSTEGPAPDYTPAAEVSALPTPTPTPSPSPSPGPSPSPSPSVSPSPSPTPSASRSPRPMPTATPIPRPTPSPRPRPRPTPAAAAGVSYGWLAGRWTRGASCSDASGTVTFSASGRFEGRRGTGRWSLSGSNAYILGPTGSDGHPGYRQIIPLERTGRDTLRLENTPYRRCR